MKLCNCQCLVQDVVIEISQILMLSTDRDDLNIQILTALNLHSILYLYTNIDLFSQTSFDQ